MNKIFWIVGVILVLGFFYFYKSTGDSSTSLKEYETENKMTFFVTSKNPGQGANFGGLSGADNYCKSLAQNVGRGDLNWKAYLSTQANRTTLAINAKDRIGKGPWHNAKGALIAKDLTELHQTGGMLNKQTALDENGNLVSGRGDEVNLHDILTGGNMDGTASTTVSDTTCSNWTSGGAGSAIVGHHDRVGLNDSLAMKSWNSSHLSRGCSLENLKSTGGGGLLYCFVAN